MTEKPSFTKYDKKYLCPLEQIELLKSRGLVFTDQEGALRALKRIGYYRLSAYWYPFKKSLKNQDGQTITIDEFHKNVSFTTILDLYVFDKKLRLLVLDALERIEISFRTSITLQIGQYSPWAHREPQYLHGNFTKKKASGSEKTFHHIWLNNLDEKFNRSSQEFALHFRDKYKNNFPPIWMASEVWDFGMLSHLYKGLAQKDKEKISLDYGVPCPVMLGDWLRTLNDIRNICAHHSRLWNKALVNQPRLPKNGEIEIFNRPTLLEEPRHRLYIVLIIISHLLKTIHPNTEWDKRVIEHFKKNFPISPHLLLKSAGFISDNIEL